MTESPEHLIPRDTPELAKSILDTASRHGLAVCYLNFSRADVGVMFDPLPTADQVLSWFDALGVEAESDRQYASHKPGQYDRTLSARSVGLKIVAWVQPKDS